VPDDVAVTYRETWDDLTPLRVGRAVVVKPAGESHEASAADRIIELPAGDGSKQGVFGTGRHPAPNFSERRKAEVHAGVRVRIGRLR